MPGLKISDLTKVTNKADLSGLDLVEMVDVSDTSMAPTGTNKAVRLTALVGELLDATPGSIVASTAVVADADGKIEGVTATQFSRLDSTPGALAAEKVVVADADAKIEGVGADDLGKLLGTDGVWAANKALIPDSSGELEGVASTQFAYLNTTPGVIQAEKALVPDSNTTVASSNMEVNAGSDPHITLSDGVSHLLVESDLVKAYTDENNYVSVSPTMVEVKSTSGATTRTIQISGDNISITDGSSTISIDVSDMSISMTGSSGELEIKNTQIGIATGINETTITANSFILNGTDSTVKLIGLPTEDPEEPGALWVDEAGYLRVSA